MSFMYPCVPSLSIAHPPKTQWRTFDGLTALVVLVALMPSPRMLLVLPPSLVLLMLLVSPLTLDATGTLHA
jgi:hypothetical protein